MPPSSSNVPAQAGSTSSSGFADGLGRRILAFDREEGAMLERLVLRPELGAFEAGLRERIERLAGLEDERLARPRSLERESTGLVVVSEFVPGSRLSDLLDTSANLGNVPGMDAALGFLLDVLPALCGLHAGVGFAHGTITPARTVLTPAGQIVLLDGIYGEALTHLRYGRRKLWEEFGVAAPDNIQGTPRLEAAADIAQAALAAVMLVLGRPVRTDEYMTGMSGLIQEVVEVAQIRGTAAFADGTQDFFNRALALDSSLPYPSTDDALFEVRQLASELGVQVCRRALVDFIEQMESPQLSLVDPADYDDVAQAIESYGLQDHAQLLDDEAAADVQLIDGADAELDLDGLVEDEPYEMPIDQPVDLEDVPATRGIDDDPVDWIQVAAASEAEAAVDHAAILRPVIGPASIDDGEEDYVPLETTSTAEVSDLEVPEPEIEEVEPSQLEEVTEPQAVETAASDAVSAVVEITAVRARRAKRPTRSVRARKDKLRSVSGSDAPAAVAAQPPEPVPAPVPEVKKPAATPWLVSPDRAAAYEPTVSIVPVFGGADPKSSPAAASVPVNAFASAPSPVPPFPTPPPVPLYAAPPPPVAVYTPPAPTVSAVAVEPAFSRSVGSIAPSYTPPPAWTPSPVTIGDPISQLTTAKLKEQPDRPRGTRAPEPGSEIYSPASPSAAVSEPTAFPWKLAAVAAAIMVVAILGARVYLPAKGVAPDDVAATSSKPGAATAATPAAQAKPVASPPASVVANAGRLEIETQPAGARILIDGKPAGESPVALDAIAAGRHTVTFISSSGSVKRTIRIEAGRTTKLDVPIFSGWVGIYAPFVVDVVEGGRVIGNTEQPRIMLSPGRHDLKLVNRDLEYSSAQTVDIEPGEVKSVSIDPRGLVNLNATPWAEVWVEGRKVGDTPLANLQLTLGVREITFRHPELGERRVTVTVKGNGPVAVSIDMTKP
jgi:hypothetical protein